MSSNPTLTPDNTQSQRDGGDRPLPALCEKVLVIGLDGATFDILRPMMDQGRMPNLAKLIEEGASGVLRSTTPPITPAAWTTFMTGKGPGRHGIFDFERYNVRTNELTFNSTYTIAERTIWQILGESGLKIGSIAVPMTYPPKPVNGFLITGFETPGTDAEFTYPPDLKEQVLQRCPDFTFKSKWDRHAGRNLEVFKNNVDQVSRSFEQGVQLVQYCGEKYGWDVLMLVYKLVDNLQHKAWKYLDPATAHRDPQRAELAAGCFRHLDNCLGELFDYARSRRASIVIISDHGHGSLDGKVQPNLLLRQWGYLGVNRIQQIGTRTRTLLRRWLAKSKGKFADNHGLEHDLAVDWSATRAFVAHAGMCGFLYLNLKGRQQTGIVSPDEYEALREQITERLLGVSVRDPAGNDIRPFAEVHKPEQLYDCDRNEYEWLPDLMLVPQPGLAVVRKIRGGGPVMWSSFRKLEGTHRMEGVLIAAGEPIRHATNLHAELQDLAPTLLAALGLKVPGDMEGRVIKEMFTKPPTVQLQDAPSDRRQTPETDVYDQREQAILTQRLAELGYLE